MRNPTSGAAAATGETGPLSGYGVRTFLFLYSLVMVAGSILTLAMVPRALKDVGHERQRLSEQLPGAEFETMVEAGYRLNNLLLLFEITYYYLLLRYAGPEWQFFYGGFIFGVIHIFYLVVGRLEKRRLSKGIAHTGLARFLIWLTALLTIVELFFLVWVMYLLLQPVPESI